MNKMDVVDMMDRLENTQSEIAFLREAINWRHEKELELSRTACDGLCGILGGIESEMEDILIELSELKRTPSKKENS